MASPFVGVGSKCAGWRRVESDLWILWINVKLAGGHIVMTISSRFFLIVALFMFAAISFNASPLSAAEYSKAKLEGKPDMASLACAKGDFWDPRNGGECWSCPSGTNRTIFPVTDGKACEKPASESLQPATKHSDNTLACPSGSFFDPRNGGECWSCPSGNSRSLTAVTAGDACVKRVGRVQGRSYYRYTVPSLLHSCKSGYFPRPGKPWCYNCLSGWKHDSSKGVYDRGVCYKPAYTQKNKATKVSSLTGVNCGSGKFFDPSQGGSCWSCPSGYNRTAYAVTDGKACAKAVSGSFTKAKKIKAAKVTALGCGVYGDDSFLDLIDGGTCWSCPKSNPVRSLASVKDGKACASKTCGKLNGRPCLVWERFPSCNKGLLEDPFTNKCIKPKDLACEAFVGTLAAFKKITDEAKKARKALKDEAMDAIPGAKLLLRFVKDQTDQLQKEQAKLMGKIDLSQVTDQLEDLVSKNPEQIKRLAEAAKTAAGAREKIMKVFLNPDVICSGSGKKIANELKKLGFANMFAQLEQSPWQKFNPVSTAYASNPEHQMSFEFSVAPPLPEPYAGLSVGMSFATDFENNHSLSMPSIGYSKSIGGDDAAINLGEVSLGIGWSYYDGQTNIGKNDVFNWATSIDLSDTVHIGIGSGGFSGISVTVSGAVSGEDLLGLFPGDKDITKKKIKFELPKLQIKAGQSIGGAFNIPLK